jgi:hypothetical protein
VPLTYVACHATVKTEAGSEPPDASTPDVGRDEYHNSLGVDGQVDAVLPPATNPLCGAEVCNPDDETACSGVVEGTADGGGGAGGNAGASGGTAGGFQLPDVDSGTRVSRYACQVTRQGVDQGTPSAMCRGSGSGETNAPCVSSSDCRPGLACVTDSMIGRCLPYCCSGNDSCDPESYCSTRPLKDGSAGTDAPVVPVCVPADNCDLAASYPCTDTASCTCPEGTACTVVRSDGTTVLRSCQAPGQGVEGDDCTSSACAWGFICSQASGTCLKLCVVNANSSDCGSRRCQSSAELPSNWGVCVGEAGDAG